MKMVSVTEARLDFDGLLEKARMRPVCITRKGKPVAVIRAVTFQRSGVMRIGEETFFTCSEELWKELQRRRKTGGRTYSIEEVRKELEKREKAALRLVPNKLTIRAIKEARRGGLPSFKTVGSLMKDLKS
jgi:antitoxin (DNA-binding transcriptional repressor) of toxin-antitoxin stability system